MQNRIRGIMKKGISLVLTVSIIINSSIGSLAGVLENEIINNNIETNQKSTPSEATSVKNNTDDTISTPSEATPNNATPSEATPSEASPSNATPIEKVDFKISTPDIEITPTYYTKISKGKYKFTDRNNNMQYRIYGYYDDSSECDWYECDENWNVTTADEFISLDWEYYNLAPYIYESVDVQTDDINTVMSLDSSNRNKVWFTYKPLSHNNWNKTTYTTIRVRVGVVMENDYSDKYYFYGRILNDSEKIDNTDDIVYNWYYSDENGNVEDRIYGRMMLMARSADLPVWGVQDGQYLADWWSSQISNLSYAHHPTDTQRYDFVTSSGFSRYILGYYKTLVDSSYSPSRITYYYKIGASKPAGNDPYTQVPTFNLDCTEPVSVEFPTADNMHQDAYWLCKDIDGPVLAFGYCDSNYMTATLKGLPSGKYSTYRYEYNEGEDGDGGWSGGRAYTFNVNQVHRGTGITQSTNATCTASGTKNVYYPECGHTATEYSPALGHDYSAGYTYKTDGYHYKYCPRDGVQLDKQPNIYYVSYNANGGSGTTNTSTHTYGQSGTLTNNGFYRQYYTFSHWNTNSSGTGTSYTNKQSVASLNGTNGATVTLYAQWVRTSNPVIFTDWDGTELKNQEVPLGGTATPPSNPSRLGYTFTGWDSLLVNVNLPLVVKAKYSINQYTASINLNGGTELKSNSKNNLEITSDYDSYRPEIKNVHIFRPGYYFSRIMSDLNGSTDKYSGNILRIEMDGTVDKAYVDSNLVILQSKNIGLWGSMPAENKTYYPDWKPFNVEFNFNDNLKDIYKNIDNSVENSSTSYNIEYKDDGSGNAIKWNEMFSLPTIERDGLEFKGWYARVIDDSEYLISPDSTVNYKLFYRDFIDNTGSTPKLMFDGSDEAYSRDVYAKWDFIKYKVKFNSNIYDNDYTTEMERVYREELGELPQLHRTGYTFEGWYTSKDGGEKIDSTTRTPLNGYEYYAHWTPNKYNVLFKYNHFRIVGKDYTKQYVFDNKLGELEYPKLVGYTFAGWRVSTASDAKQITSDSMVEPRDVEYYAKWMVNTYNLLFHPNHYEIDDNTDKILYRRDYDTKIGVLPNLEHKGYTLKGWYKATPSQATPSEASPNPASTSQATPSVALIKYDDLQESDEINSDSDVPSKNTDYFAKWEANKYKLKFNSDNIVIKKPIKTVTYDSEIGEMEIPQVIEDFDFVGWYAESYSDEDNRFELIYASDTIPKSSLQLKDDTIYRLSRDVGIYSYFKLNYYAMGNNINRRSGIDGIQGSADDNYYFNGVDKIEGTRDDRKIYDYDPSKEDNSSSYYELDDGRKVYPGKDGVFGTEDDFINNDNGSTTYPGPDCIFDTEDDIILYPSNGGKDTTIIPKVDIPKESIPDVVEIPTKSISDNNTDNNNKGNNNRDSDGGEYQITSIRTKNFSGTINIYNIVNSLDEINNSINTNNNEIVVKKESQKTDSKAEISKNNVIGMKLKSFANAVFNKISENKALTCIIFILLIFSILIMYNLVKKRKK